MDHNSNVNQDIKQKFVGQHVYANVNSLVEYIIKKGFEDNDAPFTIDDVENYYSYPEFYGTYAKFEGGTDDDRQTELSRLEDLKYTGEDDAVIKEEIEALEDLEQEPAEIFEWWAVSEYLYRNLNEKGYCVLDAGSCYAWGRTTTGQAIILDAVISNICEDMEILDGQTNSWATK